jgi:hypothetical protein
MQSVFHNIKIGAHIKKKIDGAQMHPDKVLQPLDGLVVGTRFTVHGFHKELDCLCHEWILIQMAIEEEIDDRVDNRFMSYLSEEGKFWTLFQKSTVERVIKQFWM